MNRKVVLFGTSLALLAGSAYLATNAQAQEDNGATTQQVTNDQMVNGSATLKPKQLSADGSLQPFADGKFIALSTTPDLTGGNNMMPVENGQMNIQWQLDNLKAGTKLYLLVLNGDAMHFTVDEQYLPYEFTADSNTVDLGDVTFASKLQELAITTPPTKTTYKAGESFAKDGMQVTAKYENGGAKTVANYTAQPANALTVNDTKVTLSYTENDITKTVEQPITVQPLTNYTVNFTADPNGKVAGSTTATVEEGQKVTAAQLPKVTPNSDYKFNGWVDETGKTIDPLTVAITKNQSFKATFAKASEAVQTTDLYRLYNPNSGEHFYTLDAGERANLTKLGWKAEGTIGKQPTNQGENVYRLYNKNAGDHHYTKDTGERDWLIKKGWKAEGVAFKSGGPNQVYRLYNPNAKSGSHHYTQLVSERDWLKGLGWQTEGIGWNNY